MTAHDKLQADGKPAPTIAEAPAPSAALDRVGGGDDR